MQTVDIITPVLDDPYLFGQIAAANSLSDVFAMGGEVLTALNIVGFDKKHHPDEVLVEMLRGGQSKVEECGGIIVGGHTIANKEMLYGLSVTGTIHPNKIYKNNNLQKDDVLILTKPLGMGVLTTALKNGLLEVDLINKIAAILGQLNLKASRLFKNFEVHACTDITGFGLAGHAFGMCDNKMSIEFDFQSLPIVEEALQLVQKKSIAIVDKAYKLMTKTIIPGGSLKNKAYLQGKVKNINDYENDIFFYDAQTSGGLLISVSQKDASALLQNLKDEGYEDSAIVGAVKEKQDYALYLK